MTLKTAAEPLRSNSTDDVEVASAQSGGGNHVIDDFVDNRLILEQRYVPVIYVPDLSACYSRMARDVPLGDDGVAENRFVYDRSDAHHACYSVSESVERTMRKDASPILSSGFVRGPRPGASSGKLVLRVALLKSALHIVSWSYPVCRFLSSMVIPTSLQSRSDPSALLFTVPCSVSGELPFRLGLGFVVRLGRLSIMFSALTDFSSCLRKSRGIDSR